MPFVPIATLSVATVNVVRNLLGDRPHFLLYFEAALDVPPTEGSNRRILVGSDHRGLALSIDFERVTVRTTVGTLTEPELLEAVAVPRRAELHLEPRHLEFVRARLAIRIAAIKQLRLYLLDAPTGLQPDQRCRRLNPEDEPVVREFFERHYPATIFSAWMLDQPFYGLFEQSELRACGGVVVSSRRLASSNLGNFLTDPAHRGRGLAGAVASTLIHDLEADGMGRFVLATTENNEPAWRTYQRLGFRVIETRPQVDLGPPAS